MFYCLGVGTENQLVKIGTRFGYVPLAPLRVYSRKEKYSNKNTKIQVPDILTARTGVSILFVFGT